MRQPRRATLLFGFVLLTHAGCPSATVDPFDGGTAIDAARAEADAAPNALDAAAPIDGAAPEDDAAPDPIDAAPADASPPDAGGEPGCAPPGRQYVIAATAQNAQTVTFGAGLPTERTVELQGGYVASFGPSGCFEWLARFTIPAGFLGGSRLAGDADGNVYFVTAMNALDLSIHDADDRVGARFVATTTTSTTTRPGYRGLIVGSYDRRGRLRWVERMGNAASAPANKGYSLAGLELTDGVLRVIGTANGGTRGATATYEMVFGEGHPTETRVRLGEAQQFGFIIALDPTNGAPIAGSLRVSGSRAPATNTQFRHEAEDIGEAARDGSFAVGMLLAGSATYQLNRGRPDETTIASTGQFSGVFSRYTRTGTVAWYRLGGTGMTLFSSAILADGSVLFSGNTDVGSPFDTGSGQTNLVAGANAYLVRYDRAGRLVWLRGIERRGFSRMLVDEARGALYATGEDTVPTTFGVGEPDAVTEPIQGAYVTRFDLATGRLVWIRKLEASNGSYRNLVVVGDELMVQTRIAGRGVFNLGAPDELTVSELSVWSGNARYDADDGTFRGVIEYIKQGPLRSVDGITDGLVIEP